MEEPPQNPIATVGWYLFSPFAQSTGVPAAVDKWQGYTGEHFHTQASEALKGLAESFLTPVYYRRNAFPFPSNVNNGLSIVAESLSFLLISSVFMASLYATGDIRDAAFYSTIARYGLNVISNVVMNTFELLHYPLWDASLWVENGLQRARERDRRRMRRRRRRRG